MIKPGDTVTYANHLLKGVNQRWLVVEIRGDHRTLWVRFDGEKDIWRDSRLFEVVSESR